MLPLATMVVGLLIATASLSLWAPWDNTFKIRVAFPSSAPVEPTLTEQLVFGNPPADLSASVFGDAIETGDAFFEAGYFFAAPDADFNMGQGGTGSWAAFIVTDAEGFGELDAGPSGTNVTVQDVPGVLTTAIGNQRTQLTFGPLDGRMYNVVTSQVSQPDTLAFAETVGLDGDVPVVKDASTLHGMRPLSTLAEMNSAFRVISAGISPNQSSQPGVVMVQYGTEPDRFTLTSQQASSGGLTSLQFVLGAEIDATVHGQPALTVVTNDSESLLAFGVELGSVVAWIEGGRLIVVAGRQPIEKLLQLAESVRPATPDEWRSVVGAAA